MCDDGDDFDAGKTRELCDHPDPAIRIFARRAWADIWERITTPTIAERLLKKPRE